VLEILGSNTDTELMLPRSARRGGALWLERGGNLAAVPQILGRASIGTTQRYARLTDGAVMREMQRLAGERNEERGEDVVELILSTSKRGPLRATARWKDLIDSLTCKGALNDPRTKCPEMTGVLTPLVELRGGRCLPRVETPLSHLDDTAIRVIRVHKVAAGTESIEINRATVPGTSSGQSLSFQSLEHPAASSTRPSRSSIVRFY